MSKLDEIKEDIGWLKVVFGILTAINISLIGWLAQNYENAKFFISTTVVFLIIVFTVGIIIVNKQAYKKIKELRDL